MPQTGALFDVQPDGDFVNLTEQQKDLLRLLVAKHELNGGAAFILVQSTSGFGICYQGGDSARVPNDDIDFHQLRQERLITLIPIARNQSRGKPTERGITLVRNAALDEVAAVVSPVTYAAAIDPPKPERAGDTVPNAEPDTESANQEDWISRLKAELSPDQLEQVVDSMNKITEILEAEASAPTQTLTIANLDFSVRDLQSLAPRELCAVLEVMVTELRARATAGRILRLVPGTDTTPRALEAASAQSQPPITPNSQRVGRRHGPKPDYATAARVAEIVARVAPDGDWHPREYAIREELDKAGVPCPATWPKRDSGCDSWAAQIDRATAVKAIEYRLDLARQRKKATPETLS